MLRVIVHVRHHQGGLGTDVEVPAETPLEQLAGLLSKALGWNDCGQDESVTYTVWNTANNDPLSPLATLAELKLWDGTDLLFKPVIHRSSPSFTRVQPAMLVSESGRCYPLVTSTHRLGRSSRVGSNDATLIDLKSEPLARTVSRYHANVRYQQLGWVVQCVSETQNQTLRNGELLQPSESYRLEDGDWLQLGGIKLWFQTGSSESDADHD